MVCVGGRGWREGVCVGWGMGERGGEGGGGGVCVWRGRWREVVWGGREKVVVVVVCVGRGADRRCVTVCGLWRQRSERRKERFKKEREEGGCVCVGGGGGGEKKAPVPPGGSFGGCLHHSHGTRQIENASLFR